MDWQPINTVVKDGRLVDLWHRDGFAVYETWWDDEDGWVCGQPESDFVHWRLTEWPGGGSRYPEPEER